MSGYIYFIKEEHSGLVKIGRSKDPWGRLSKIQSDSPGALTPLCFEPGDATYEAELHQRFSADRVRGEWFRFSAAVAEHVERIGPPHKSSKSLGGTVGLVAQYVAATGVSPKAARHWLERGRIPGGYWLKLVDAGIHTFEELHASYCANLRRNTHKEAA